jgi:hypothetical protein
VTATRPFDDQGITMDRDHRGDEPPKDDMDEGVTARQLLHAATGDRDAEARALADRADGEVGEDEARAAVGRAHGELGHDRKPESDIADPDDARTEQD